MITIYYNLTNATDSNEIAGSHEQHAINFVEGRSDVRQKKTNDRQLTEMNEFMTEAKNETKDLVAKGKKGALSMF